MQDEIQRLIARVNDAHANERHMNYKETMYWFRQWKQIALDATAILANKK